MTLDEKLSGKNILFFSVQTFNLEKEIIKKMEEHGANVEYYDERPSNSDFIKGLIRIKRSIYQHKIDEYYKQILASTTNKNYDFLFLNRGEVMTEFFLEEFKALHPECEFIFYTWDSISNQGHPVKIIKYFKRKYTFDSDDSTKYGMAFRPLFFLDSYREIKRVKTKNFKCDLLFLGTAHSDRYKISSFIVNWCQQHNLTSYCYYYMHGRLVYFYKRLLDSTFKEFDYKKLNFKSLEIGEILEFYKTSKVILDINHPGQTGLTMRTFEAIGAGKKIITTNQNVKKYLFYNPQNILVIDRDNISIDLNFFKTDYEDIEEVLYDKLSIDGWLYDIFIEEDGTYWSKFASVT